MYIYCLLILALSLSHTIIRLDFFSQFIAYSFHLILDYIFHSIESIELFYITIYINFSNTDTTTTNNNNNTNQPIKKK